jgi:predicted methyltransferase
VSRTLRTAAPVFAISVAAAVLAACGGFEPPPAPPSLPQNPPMVDPAMAEMMGDAPPPGAPAPAMSADKKAEEARKLEQDFAKLAEDIAKEKARFTPELEAKTKALADADYKNLEKGLRTILASEHRTPGDKDRDAWRHPIETLTFFGLKPESKVLEFGGGGGWYTEILAPFVAKKGKMAVTGTDPNGPRTVRATLYGQRLKAFLDKSPALGGKIDFVIIDPNKANLGPENSYDLIIAMREMHGWHRNGNLDKNLAEAFRVLKPGGVFGVEQHRAKPDADPKESAEKGYLPEKWVIERAVAAGFKLEGKSEVNANAKDTKDYADGVWMLPPNLRAPEADKAKYKAIGESDRMTLKFVKPKTTQAPAPAPAKK